MEKIKNITKIIVKENPCVVEIERKNEEKEIIEIKSWKQFPSLIQFIIANKLQDITEVKFDETNN